MFYPTLYVVHSERRRNEVFREVFSLANLDHPNIVRFDTSWFESPPPGWQEQCDMHYRDMFSTMEFTSEQNSPSAREERLVNSPGDSNDSSYVVHESHDVGSSIPGQNVVDTTDSFDIVFQHSQKVVSQGDSDCRKRLALSDDELSPAGSGCANRTGQSGDASTSLSRRKSDTRDVVKASNKQRSACTPRLLLYIQMELCHLKSLSDWFRSNKQNRDFNHMLDIFYQILLAVDYIHGHCFMHRDLKVWHHF